MYKQKLIDLLKSDEQTKEAIEKLEFGCKVNYLLSDGSTDIGIYCFQLGLKMFLTDSGLEVENSNILEKIGLPLQERFIRMYCEKKKIIIDFSSQENTFIIILKGLHREYILIDNTKDFDNQDDEVYQKIYEALLELN